MKHEDEPIMEMASVMRSLEWQATHAEENNAPNTARVIRGFIPLLDSELMIGEKMKNWPGLSLEDAMPLRLAGGFHNLCLTGADARLVQVYAGHVTAQDDIDRIVVAVARDHDDRLLEWFDGPPQTNEAGRSAGVMGGLLWLSGRIGPRFELIEIGSSAGINTMMNRFAFDLAGVKAGPQDSPMHIQPEWRGEPPPDNPVEITGVQGCDVAPVDLTDRDEALRLKSYVWPEVTARMVRFDAAIALAAEQAPQVEHCEAGGFVERQLAERREAGVARVLFHTVVWQYLPPETQAQIEAAMEQAGAAATAEHPLGWVRVETNRQTFRHEICARFWPGGEDWTLLGDAHAHGAWVNWLGA